MRTKRPSLAATLAAAALVASGCGSGGNGSDSGDTAGEDPAVTDSSDPGEDPGADSAADPAGDADAGEDAWIDPCALPSTPSGLFDMDMLADPSTLDVEIIEETEYDNGYGMTLHVREILYTSWEWVDCLPSPIRIQGFVAIPPGTPATGATPGIVWAHGKDGSASDSMAGDAAGGAMSVVLAFSGPGQGGSGGTGSTDDHFFDTVPDPRESWQFEHAIAAIRGITVLASLPEVDPDALGMVGHSAGGIATWIVNGVDARLRAAIPVSAVGHLDMAAHATPVPGWEVAILGGMTPPRGLDSPEWIAFEEWLDPARYLDTAHAPTLVANGAQDEFFTIDATALTFDELQASAGTGGSSRILEIADWDHGCFDTLDPAAAAAGWSDVSYAFVWWMGHHLGNVADFSAEPPDPAAPTISEATCTDPVDPGITWTCASVDAALEAPTAYTVTAASFNWSVDSSLTWESADLSPGGDGTWSAVIEDLDASVWDDSSMVSFVRFEFEAGAWHRPFALTSRPNVPPGFVPHVMTLSCTP